MQLNEHEARVLGVLIEKSFTTPEQYPLSLNAATNGANQKSNRDPVVDWLEDEVFIALTGLCHKLLAGKVQPAGSRVEKYRHNAGEVLKLSSGALAVLAELLMRGPQTAGELRARSSRMVAMATQADLAGFVEELEGCGHAKHVSPAPGSRAGRIAQTLVEGLHSLTSAPSAAASQTPVASAAPPSAASAASMAAAPSTDRVAQLEARVARLEGQLRSLAAALGETLPDESESNETR